MHKDIVAILKGAFVLEICTEIFIDEMMYHWNLPQRNLAVGRIGNNVRWNEIGYKLVLIEAG